MAKRSGKSQKSQVKTEALVVVTYAEDLEQARDYEAVLKNSDIPAVVRQQEGQVEGEKKFAVMVPEQFVDEAHVVIESQDAYDDFYDFALDYEDDNFEDNYFDTDF